MRTRIPRLRRIGAGVIGAGWLVVALAVGSTVASAATSESDELFTPYLMAAARPDSRAAAPLIAAINPDGRSAPGDFDQLVRVAVLLVKRGQHATAIRLLEPYHTTDDFLLLHALGVAYVRTDRNSEAYETLLRAHRLNPSVAAPLLPAALACARIARRCDEYRHLALTYKELGGKFTRFADKIANHLPFTLNFTRRS
jgi:Flp pilus assembly protein TadD